MLDPDDRLVGLVRAALPAGETVGIAVSGGGDSTALLHLARAAGLRVQAVTVDHRLRAGSADEAAAVAAACSTLGVPHAVQAWEHGPEHGPVAGNLMDVSRRARMALIQDWAKARGIAHVALGHTRDDQAETLLMGLARAAGLPGLSGMRRQWEAGGVTFHRPLLDAGRDDLRAWLRARGVPWVDDPTNDDLRFQRVKARAVLAALAPLGISAEGLAAVAGNLASAQAALAVQVAAAVRHLTPVAGALRIGPGLWAEPGEVQRQVVAQAVRWLRRGAYPPRAEDLRRLLHALQAGQDATLAGCRHRRGWLLPEARSLGPDAAVGDLWDGRWIVAGPPGTVRALAAGLAQVPGWRDLGLPREVLAATPAVWLHDRLLSAPLAGWENGWSARLDAGAALFPRTD